jgi:hypothetical protein
MSDTRAPTPDDPLVRRLDALGQALRTNAGADPASDWLERTPSPRPRSVAGARWVPVGLAAAIAIIASVLWMTFRQTSSSRRTASLAHAHSAHPPREDRTGSDADRSSPELALPAPRSISVTDPFRATDALNAARIDELLARPLGGSTLNPR